MTDPSHVRPSALAPVRTGRTVVFAVGALSVGLAVGLVVSPDAARLDPPPPTAQAVVSTTFVCPDFKGAERAASTTIVATVPKGLTTGVGTRGRAVLAPLVKRGTPQAIGSIASPGGAVIVTSARSSVGPIVGAGSGWLAPGFSAGQLTVQFSGLERGLAGIDCADVASEQWFVGGGAATGQRTSLILVNPESSAASVDVEIFGQAGRVDAPGGQGVVIRSRSTRVVALDTLAPGQGIIAVHVKADVGRLVMALKTTDRFGSEARGTDFVPPGTAPTRRLVIPALPSGAGSRDLLLVAPGNDDADVQIKVIGRSETFAPAGADRFTVSAGSVRKIDLSKILTSENSAILIESDVPVVAGARVRFRADGRGQKAEYAWSAAVPPLSTSAIEASSRVGDGFAAQLLLSSPDGVGRVEILTGAPGRAAQRRTLTINPGITYTLSLGGRGDRGQIVTVVRSLPGSAPVWAGRVQTRKSLDGVLVTISPLRDARISVEVPQALPDLSAAVPGR